jgi:hypothetical protein
MKNSYAAIVLWLILTLFCVALYQVQHENAHAEIYKNHGCINVTIQYSLIKGTTTCHTWQNDLMPDYRIQEASLNSWNEIIGYHFQILMVIVLSIGLIFFCLKKPTEGKHATQ